MNHAFHIRIQESPLQVSTYASFNVNNQISQLISLTVIISLHVSHQLMFDWQLQTPFQFTLIQMYKNHWSLMKSIKKQVIPILCHVEA